MRINYQLFYQDLQECIIEMLTSDNEDNKTFAARLNNIVEHLKGKQKKPIFSDEY